MTRTRILIACSAAITVLAATATISSAADKKLYSTMTGAQEKPAGDTNGKGTAVLTFRSSQVCYDIRPQKSGLTFAAGHIHTGAKGTAGDVLIALFQTPKKIKGGKLVGCAKAKPAAIAKVKAKPAGFYLNIHSAAFPAGVIRGQLTAKKPVT